MKTNLLNVEEIAAIAHQANAAVCRAFNDNSQPDWDNAPEWQRESAIEGVKNLLSNPDLTPEQSHESWLKHKELDGWSYGPVKDPDAKKHPCMIPYDQLSTEQRAKDHLFTAIVKAASRPQQQR